MYEASQRHGRMFGQKVDFSPLKSSLFNVDFHTIKILFWSAEKHSYKDYQKIYMMVEYHIFDISS